VYGGTGRRSSLGSEDCQWGKESGWVESRFGSGNNSNKKNVKVLGISTDV